MASINYNTHHLPFAKDVRDRVGGHWPFAEVFSIVLHNFLPAVKISQRTTNS